MATNGNGSASVRADWVLHQLESCLRHERRMTAAEMKLERIDKKVAAVETEYHADKEAVRMAWVSLLRGALAVMTATVMALVLNGADLWRAIGQFLKH